MKPKFRNYRYNKGKVPLKKIAAICELHKKKIPIIIGVGFILKNGDKDELN